MLVIFKLCQVVIFYRFPRYLDIIARKYFAMLAIFNCAEFPNYFVLLPGLLHAILRKIYNQIFKSNYQ